MMRGVGLGLGFTPKTLHPRVAPSQGEPGGGEQPCRVPRLHRRLPPRPITMTTDRDAGGGLLAALGGGTERAVGTGGCP